MTAFAVVVGVIGAASGLFALWQSGRLAQQNRALAAQSDSIQERLALVEEARRRDELRPSLSAKTDAGRSLLTIANESTADLDLVEVREVVQVPPVIEQDIKSILGMHPLRMGESWLMPVHRVADEAGGRLVLRLRLTSASDTWEVTVDCEIDGSQSVPFAFV